MEDRKERSQSIHKKADQEFENGKVHLGTDSHTALKEMLAAKIFFGEQALSHYHTHPNDLWNFSMRDIALFVSNPRLSYFEILGNKEGVSLLVRTDKAFKLPISSTTRQLVTEKLKKIDTTDLAKVAEVYEQYGIGLYFWQSPDRTIQKGDLGNGAVFKRIHPQEAIKDSVTPDATSVPDKVEENAYPEYPPRFKLDINSLDDRIQKTIRFSLEGRDPDPASAEYWKKDGFEVIDALRTIHGPIIEVAGPTRGGYSLVDLSKLDRNIFVSNITPGLGLSDPRTTEFIGYAGKVDLQADATKLPLASNKVGALFTSCLSHFMAPPFINEAMRTLEPGGLLIYQGGRSENMNYALKAGFQVVESQSEKGPGGLTINAIFVKPDVSPVNTPTKAFSVPTSMDKFKSEGQRQDSQWKKSLK